MLGLRVYRLIRRLVAALGIAVWRRRRYLRIARAAWHRRIRDVLWLGWFLDLMGLVGVAYHAFVLARVK